VAVSLGVATVGSADLEPMVALDGPVGDPDMRLVVPSGLPAEAPGRLCGGRSGWAEGWGPH
jgi:hypothetical protein